jgi:hypothetical protein
VSLMFSCGLISSFNSSTIANLFSKFDFKFVCKLLKCIFYCPCRSSRTGQTLLLMGGIENLLSYQGFQLGILLFSSIK